MKRVDRKQGTDIKYLLMIVDSDLQRKLCDVESYKFRKLFK